MPCSWMDEEVSGIIRRVVVLVKRKGFSKISLYLRQVIWYLKSYFFVAFGFATGWILAVLRAEEALLGKNGILIGTFWKHASC